MSAVYISSPEVAAAYHVAPGEWATVNDEAEAAWLLLYRHGWSANAVDPLPAPGFVHPLAPAFSPYRPGGPVAPPKAKGKA